MPRRTQAQKESQNRKTSEAMKRIAESKKCPDCLRKSALKYIGSSSGGLVEICRWEDCDYKREIAPGEKP